MRHTLLKLPHELIGSILHVMRRGILPSLLLAGKAEREAKLALIPGPSYPPIFASSSCSTRQALTQSICLAYLFLFRQQHQSTLLPPYTRHSVYPLDKMSRMAPIPRPSEGDVYIGYKLETDTTVTFIAATIVVGLRFIARMFYARLGWDDYVMCSLSYAANETPSQFGSSC